MQLPRIINTFTPHFDGYSCVLQLARITSYPFNKHWKFGYSAYVQCFVCFAQSGEALRVQAQVRLLLFPLSLDGHSLLMDTNCSSVDVTSTVADAYSMS
jgi:hypothetical protein